MKRRIKSAQSILWVLLLILSASCSKDEIQIVDQDTSWQMDNKYIEEDIREQLGIVPFTDLVYLGYYRQSLHTVGGNQRPGKYHTGGKERTFVQSKSDEALQRRYQSQSYERRQTGNRFSRDGRREYLFFRARTAPLKAVC